MKEAAMYRDFFLKLPRRSALRFWKGCVYPEWGPEDENEPAELGV